MYVEVHKGTTTAKTSKEIFEANQSLRISFKTLIGTTQRQVTVVPRSFFG